MADSTAGPLTLALAATLRQATRLAVGTCVTALVLAAVLGGEAPERFATTAYLAAIFLAVVLVASRLLRGGVTAGTGAGAAFPSFLSYSVCVAIFLSVGATLVSQPGGEVLATFACVALIVAVAAVRCGAVASLNGALVRGGFLAAASRYAVLGTVVAFGIAALTGGDAGETFTKFAYRLMVLVAMLIVASLLAPGIIGVWLRRNFERSVATLDRYMRALVFERTATSAAFAAVAAMLVASIVPVGFAEPFAIIAYLAGAAAVVGVAMECRRLRS
jgi:hypothetical protein